MYACTMQMTTPAAARPPAADAPSGAVLKSEWIHHPAEGWTGWHHSRGSLLCLAPNRSTLLMAPTLEPALTPEKRGNKPPAAEHELDSNGGSL